MKTPRQRRRSTHGFFAASSAKVGAAFNELMYGARELAFRVEDETRSGGGDLLMRSPFEDAADPHSG